jgi:hypothetical protein
MHFLSCLQMGFVTGYPWAPQEYRDKCKGKDESSTQGSLGFRISGMQVCVMIPLLIRFITNEADE